MSRSVLRDCDVDYVDSSEPKTNLANLSNIKIFITYDITLRSCPPGWSNVAVVNFSLISADSFVYCLRNVAMATVSLTSA